MNERIETIILQHLIADLTFAVQVLPHMTPELFRDRKERALFAVISQHVTKYTASPTFEQLFLALENHPLTPGRLRFARRAHELRNLSRVSAPKPGMAAR